MTWGTGHPRASTPEWKRTRRLVLERDGYRCACGRRATEVDHVIEWSDGGSDHPSNLRAICDACHKHKTARHAARARWAKHTTRRADEAHPGLTTQGRAVSPHPERTTAGDGARPVYGFQTPASVAL